MESARELEQLPEQESAPFHRGELPIEERNYGDQYVPEILTPEEQAMLQETFDEKPPSKLAQERIGAILSLLTRDPSKLAVMFKRGAALKDLSFYPFRFPLTGESADPYILFAHLKGLKCGDVVRMTAYGDDLYFRVTGSNIYEDPLKRQEYVKVLADLEKKLASQRGKLDLGLRVTALEKLASEDKHYREVIKKHEQAVQMLLMLHSREKFNHEMVTYIRSNTASLQRKVDELTAKNSRLEASVESLKNLVKSLVNHHHHPEQPPAEHS